MCWSKRRFANKARWGAVLGTHLSAYVFATLTLAHTGLSSPPLRYGDVFATLTRALPGARRLRRQLPH